MYDFYTRFLNVLMYDFLYSYFHCSNVMLFHGFKCFNVLFLYMVLNALMYDFYTGPCEKLHICRSCTQSKYINK